MEISGQGLRDLLRWMRDPLGPTTVPRVGWMVFRRLPGLRRISRGLGLLRPPVNIGLAMADCWIALDDWVKAKRNPDLETIFVATASSVLATCSLVTAMNIPLISRLTAVLAICIDFFKHMLLNMSSDAPQVLELIAYPSAGGRLESAPAQAVHAF